MIKSVCEFARATCWIEIPPQLPKMDRRNQEILSIFWIVVVVEKKELSDPL